MSDKQMRFQVTSKLTEQNNSWITQTVKQRIPNCWARNGESTSTESAATDAWNDELTATGGSQMLATRNRGDRHTVIGEVRWWRSKDSLCIYLDDRSLRSLVL